MRIFLCTIAFFITSFLPFVTNAQLRVNDKVSAQEAVRRLVGDGVKVSNVRVNCPSQRKTPFGYFTDNTGSLGMAEGLVMTSGAAADAVGPNNSGTTGQENNNKDVKDQELSSLVSGTETVNDACIIEFDIEVYADTLVFNYLFGSEEYPEFEKEYHDVFGFFISGPGFSNRENIALVPGQNLPVSVANINSYTNNQYYVSNGTGSTPFINRFLQYDGYTKVLQCKVAVEPCRQYTLKLAIADVKDDIYDAGVFIEGKSLRTPVPKVRTVFDYQRFNYAVEGCSGGKFVFTRTTRLAQAYTLQLAVSGTAQNGIDYNLIPNFIRFEPGQRTAVLNINPKADTEKENVETVTVTLLNACTGEPTGQKATINIRDEFEAKVPDASACIGDSIKLNPVPVSAFSYKWFNNSMLSCMQCASPWAVTPADTSFVVQITDTLTRCVTTDTLQVKIVQKPEAKFSFKNDDNYTALDIFFTDLSTNGKSYRWDFGDGTTAVDRNPSHTFAPPPPGQAEQVYKVTLAVMGGTANCTDTATQVITIKQQLPDDGQGGGGGTDGGHNGGNSGDGGGTVNFGFFLPNVFTPNGDDKNQTFKILGIKAGIWHLEVFNRFGASVYESKAYRNDWDGGNLPAGVYFFELKNPPQTRRYKGWVHILR